LCRYLLFFYGDLIGSCLTAIAGNDHVDFNITSVNRSCVDLATQQFARLLPYVLAFMKARLTIKLIGGEVEITVGAIETRLKILYLVSSQGYLASQLLFTAQVSFSSYQGSPTRQHKHMCIDDVALSLCAISA
jgi:hypothetical protein